jgi:hypothetical protein
MGDVHGIQYGRTGNSSGWKNGLTTKFHDLKTTTRSVMAPREHSEIWRASVRSSEYRVVSKNWKAMFAFKLKEI